MNQLKWGVLLSYLSMGLGILVSLVYTPFMLRLLGQSEWGLYSLVASVVGYLHLLGFGFGSAYVRYYARAVASDDAAEVARLNGLFLIVFSAISMLVVIAGVLLFANVGTIFGDKLTPREISTARVLVGIMTFTVALSFPASVFKSFITANERFFFQRLLGLVRMVATPALTLFVLIVGYRSIGMAVVVAGVALAVAAADVVYCVGRLEIRFSFRQLDRSLLGEIAVFSSYIFINMVTDQVNWNVDKFILGRVGGTVAVAVYALAALLNVHYMSLSTTVSSVFVPRVNRLVATADDNEALTHLFTRVGRVQFLVLALVSSTLVVFGQAFITTWAGEDYAGAYPIMLLMIIPVTIPLIQNLGIEIQRAKNLHKFRSWVYLGIAVVNVVLTIPLAQRYGGVGAAAATGAAVLLGPGLFMNVYYHRRVGLDMRYFWKGIARFSPAFAPVAITGAAIMYFADLRSPWWAIAWGFAFIGVYCLSFWFLGLNTYEKNLIGKPVLRLSRRLW